MVPLLRPEARDWLEEALSDAAQRPVAAGPGGPAAPPRWELHFAAAGRRCRAPDGQDLRARPAAQDGGGPPPTARRRGTAAPLGPADVVDAVRLLLLRAAAAGPATVDRLYRQGTAAERRAVLRALPHLALGDSAVPLVEDALRTNDTGLLAAAVGPYAARHLDAHGWRHAVLKCLGVGVPAATVADLERRARGDAELARMLVAHADERTAAGRCVPDDLPRLLALAAGDSAPEDSP
ncbi:sugar phosphate isomerase [Streptomyces solincola]|uniref:Sugar phosphate isomerase n=1 Tax=Streptomyces solincola TaxID=2100817 RepID=A0A2S9Q1W4_9ACTN|nr:EboA domain-containing protein [Streptomyces solincola]PRH80670.1 sugar phosphate isomerase [Streptomyces solincola]